MTDYITLPLEAHGDNRSVFLEHAWNIGRAYRNQALELISICLLLSRIAPPKLAYEDAELRRKLRVCDLALRSAANSGTKVTDEANARFEEATWVLSSHSCAEGGHRLDLPSVYSRMEIARQNDCIERDWSHVVRLAYMSLYTSHPTLLSQKSEDEWRPTMTVNFVILRSPLLSIHTPETAVVSQELSADPSFPEILWNFSRYKDHARITLEQNPHFYLRCPTNVNAYTPKFRRCPLQDPSGVLEHNGTVYVLFDSPGRVFLTTDHKPRIFGNVWSLNGSLIFRDRSGILEGEQLVRSSSIRYNLWCCEEPVVRQDSGSRSRLNHGSLRPILTAPSADHSADWTSKDWTVSSHPASHFNDIHGSRESTSSLDLAPPPPTSERSGYDVLYVTINGLNDDILLGIFDYYRLDEKNAWNVRLGWRKLSHTCRRWRHLVYSSAFHLGMQIHCTNGTPIVDMLDHLPPLPLVINYQYIRGQDGLGIYHALRSRDRVRRIDLHLQPLILHNFLMLMDKPFPILEHLSLSFTVDKTTTLTLPKTFLAPNLRHLSLFSIRLPKRLRLLSSTVSLVTLVLSNIQASGYFRPRLLVARLQSLPQLEELTISFSVPVPRPSAERELLGKQGIPVTLPNLRNLRFQGISAYLERFVAQIRVPLLERLSITLFNQIAFAIPYLSNLTKGFKFPFAEVNFGRDAVSIITDDNTQRYNGRFSLHVTCRQLDWQIDCAVQICSALMPALSGVKKLTLKFYDRVMPTEWQNGEIDSTTWHEFLRAFIGVKELHICAALSQELSRALEVDEARSDPGLLPGLQELVTEFEWKHTDNPFGSFVDARRITRSPLRRRLRTPPPPSPSPNVQLTQPWDTSPEPSSGEETGGETRITHRLIRRRLPVRPPPRVHSTQPRDTSPELSSGEETGGETRDTGHLYDIPLHVQSTQPRDTSPEPTSDDETTTGET
ncbi:hypothetical protein EDB83DRAFT_2675313 [Lactarius deliciosus]|nr:hypothetical protein EDB83DRAFT_2675313 [Lactarius deliciosus]